VSVQELANLIGRQAIWHIFDLEIPVEIVDARYNFGRTDVQVKPVGGNGTHWITDRAIVQD
jgi:hypothetical protein